MIITKDRGMIEKKIRCMHCNEVMVVSGYSTVPTKCSCGKIAHNNGVITEGVQGDDWVDVSPMLLNE